MASGNREHEGRAAKRQKFDHTFGEQPAPSKAYLRKTNIGEFSGEFAGSQLISYFKDNRIGPSWRQKPSTSMKLNPPTMSENDGVAVSKIDRHRMS